MQAKEFVVDQKKLNDNINYVNLKKGISMKKLLTIALLLCAFGFAAQSVKAEEPFGFAIYGDYTTPADYTIPGAKRAATTKMGEATCKSIVGVKLGDCSLTTAMTNGKIATVSYADWYKKSIMGVYNIKTLKVYGN